MKITTITQAQTTTLTTFPYFDLLCLLQWQSGSDFVTYLDSPHDRDTLEYLYYTFAGSLSYTDEANQLQVGQAGSMQIISPLNHEYVTFSADYQGLVCGFDPELMPSLANTPLFQNYFSELFPLTESDEVAEKTLLGPGSPAKLAIDCHLYEITLEPHTTWKYTVEHGRHCGIFVINGQLEMADQSPLHIRDCRFFTAITNDVLLSVTATEHTHFFIFDLVAQR
ncbi:MAG: hypothetical protein ACRC6H_04255 [Culicoidibacterales bacterium]